MTKTTKLKKCCLCDSKEVFVQDKEGFYYCYKHGAIQNNFLEAIGK